MVVARIVTKEVMINGIVITSDNDDQYHKKNDQQT